MWDAHTSPTTCIVDQVRQVASVGLEVWGAGSTEPLRRRTLYPLSYGGLGSKCGFLSVRRFVPHTRTYSTPSKISLCADIDRGPKRRMAHGR